MSGSPFTWRSVPRFKGFDEAWLARHNGANPSGSAPETPSCGHQKYGNRPLEADGYDWDSQAEYERYRVLVLLERAGKIRELRVKPRFVLQPRFVDRTTGKMVREIVYEADFSYRYPNGNDLVIEDVKGRETKDFRIKWKMLQFQFREQDVVLRLHRVV